MIIRCIERDSSPILRAILARQAEADAARPTGLHLSAIIQHYVDQVYPNEAKARERRALTEKQRVSTFEVGDIIEELIAEELRRRAGWEKPKPKKHQGVWCSPDGWIGSSRTIDEMKSTRSSSRDVVIRPTGQVDGIEDSPKFLRYVLQVKCYMHVWQAKRGRLHVLFLNGDWRPPFPDPHPPFLLRPETPHECKESWEAMMDHAQEWGLR